jgi:hypothetical protein
VAAAQSFGDRAHVQLTGVAAEEGIARVVAALQRDGVQVLSARPIQPSLEDVFIDLISERGQ